jgi:hypothetical protein
VVSCMLQRNCVFVRNGGCICHLLYHL